MRFRPVFLAAAFVMAALAAEPAEAQQRLHLGPHLSYNFDAEELGIGAQFSYPLARRLELYPSFDYYFVDNGSLWTINADLKYRLLVDREWLYGGGGLNITRATVGGNGNTDAGLNLLAGLETRLGRVHPYAEGRLTIGDGSMFQLAAGLNFTLGKSVDVE